MRRGARAAAPACARALTTLGCAARAAACITPHLPPPPLRAPPRARQLLPPGLAGFAGMLRLWSFTAFFVAAELFGDVCMVRAVWSAGGGMPP